MPVSDEKLAANRANWAEAAKSTSSKTPQGKRNSSRNALKHGFLAKCILVGEESPEAFHQLHRSIVREFRPETPYEHALVETTTVARWRQFRLWPIESAAIRHQQDRQIAAHAVDGSEQPSDRVMLTVRVLIEAGRHDAPKGRESVSEYVSRHETRFDRQFHRAADRLLALKKKNNAYEATHPIENKPYGPEIHPETNHERTLNEP